MHPVDNIIFRPICTHFHTWSDHIILLTQAASLLRKSLHSCFPKMLHACYHLLLHPLSIYGIFSSRLNRIPIVGPNSTVASDQSVSYYRSNITYHIIASKSIFFLHQQFTVFQKMHLPKTTNHSEYGWSFPKFLWNLSQSLQQSLVHC